MAEAEQDGAERLREAALDALARYRAREERDDAEWALLLRASEAENAPKRRIELIEWAEREHGLPSDRAAFIHDIAREEGLDPAFAFELVRCGVGVQELGDPVVDETLVEGPPEWVAPPVPAGFSPARERLLRASFRRLRAHLAAAPTPEAALVAFVEEPDVGEVVY
jgi:hypothetical protein